MKYEKIFPIFTIALVIVYGIFNYILHKNKKLKSFKETDKSSFVYKNKELSEENIVNYIVNVINNGSNRFHFKGGVMEGGYVPKDKARDVACYVYELSGRKCNRAYSKDAALYFSSNCAGCHGNDGKGLNGSYPNLTKKVLLGLQKD